MGSLLKETQRILSYFLLSAYKTNIYCLCFLYSDLISHFKHVFKTPNKNAFSLNELYNLKHTLDFRLKSFTNIKYEYVQGFTTTSGTHINTHILKPVLESAKKNRKCFSYTLCKLCNLYYILLSKC